MVALKSIPIFDQIPRCVAILTVKGKLCVNMAYEHLIKMICMIVFTIKFYLDCDDNITNFGRIANVRHRAGPSAFE